MPPCEDKAWFRFLDRLFGIDLRALASFRISVGILLLVDLFDRASDLEAHYSDAGVLSRLDFERLFDLSPWSWSIHLLVGSVEGQAALFLAAAVAALALAVGYRTRLATALSWFLLVSLQARNPMLLYGADQLLRLLLFWSIFLPLGAFCSVDRVRLGGSANRSKRNLSAASVAILLQMSAMYLFSGQLKRNPDWQSGEALSHTLALDAYARPWAETFLQFPDLLGQTTRMVPWLEMTMGLLLFIPWATAKFRGVALLLLFGFHLGIAMLLVTGLFPYICLTGLVLFLPTGFWDRLGNVDELAPGPLPHPEPRAAARWAAIVVVQIVVLALFSYGMAWNIAGLGLDEYWAKQRMDWALERLRSPGANGLPILSRDAIVEKRLGSFGAIGRVASLHQRWDMFYRSGALDGGWHVLVGTLQDGAKISLFEGGAPFLGGSYPKPVLSGAGYPNTRWTVNFTYLRSSGMKVLRDRLAMVIGRDWNRRHPERPIERLEILFVEDRPGSGPAPDKRRVTVWFDGPVLPAATG